MRTNWITPAVVGATLLMLSHVGAQTDFQWHGRLASGQTIELKGINGDIRATASSSGEVEVTAARSARRSNPADVRIEVVPHAGGVNVDQAGAEGYQEEIPAAFALSDSKASSSCS